MSHTAEVYAKDLGVKIGQPKITEHFIPGLPEKYITLYPSNRTKSSTYNYWQIVIFLIKPILLKEKIRIIQRMRRKIEVSSSTDLTNSAARSMQF